LLQRTIEPISEAATLSDAHPATAVAPLESQEIVILGITDSGATFRPTDWAERLCGLLSHFSIDQRIRYSPYVRPIVADGVKCVVVDARLQVWKPEAFEFLLSFARDNALLLRAGRGDERNRADAAGERPAAAAVSVP
jgi:hypothetical protein